MTPIHLPRRSPRLKGEYLTDEFHVELEDSDIYQSEDSVMHEMSETIRQFSMDRFSDDEEDGRNGKDPLE